MSQAGAGNPREKTLTISLFASFNKKLVSW